MSTGKRALVTGANGHVGRNLVAALLERGYAVRASVRDTSDRSKTAGLPVGDIELVNLDVRDEKQFASVSADIDILFHVAATYRHYTGSKGGDEAMIRDSLDGARSAVMAAAKNRVRRVVLTSSVVAVPLAAPGGPPVTEAEWRTDFSFPYYRAKTAAEQEAWKLAKENAVNLVSVLPGATIGPGFTRSTPSTDVIETIVLGGMKMGAPDSNIPLVDIRDVVAGHVLAGESDKGGRFIVCNDTFPSFLELTRIVNRIDPSVPAATRLIPAFAMAFGPFFDWLNHKTLGTPRLITGEFIASVKGKVWTPSNARAKRELGWRPQIPVEQSVAETMAALRMLRLNRPAARTGGR